MSNTNMSDKDFEKKIVEIISSSRTRKILYVGSNVYATVIPSEEKIIFSARIRNKSKDTRITIGNYPDMTLKDARRKALLVIKEQKDQVFTEKQKKLAPTLREVLGEWLAYKNRQYKTGSTRISNLISINNTTIEPSGLADVLIDKITPKIVCEKLNSIDQTAGNKHNAVSMLISCLQYSYLKGDLPFNPISDMLKGRESPFKKPKAKGFKYIAPDAIAEKFLIPLSATSEVNRVFYLYLLLTGFRFGEVRLAHWSWFDFDKELIIIPPDAIGANKTQTEYIKPMTKQIKNLLLNWKGRNYIENCDYVFRSETTNKAICEGSFREPIKALTSRELDPHGIRKVMRSWMSSQDIPVKIAELALQHDVRSAIEKVYDKYSYVEEIREALQKWNDYIEGLLPQRFLELLTA